MRKCTFLSFKILLALLLLQLLPGMGYAQVTPVIPEDGPGQPQHLDYVQEQLLLKKASVPGNISEILAGYQQTTDNEDNTGTGAADNDLDVFLYRYNTPPAPIEFNIFITEAAVTTARLSIYANDVDWRTYPNDPDANEWDAVYINGHFLGYLSGVSSQWSTTSFNFDPAWVNPVGVNGGKNTVRIEIDIKETNDWWLKVDWGQLSINEQSGNVVVRTAGLNKTCFVACDNVGLTVEVDADPPTAVLVEAQLVDNNGGIIDQNDASFTATTGTEAYTATLEAIDCTTLPGEDYLIKIFVYENIGGEKGVQLAYKEVEVPVCGCGIVEVSPDVMICNGDKTQLNATGALAYSWAPATGLSATDIANPVASPSVTTTYTVTGSFPAVELLGNPGFEAGNTGFTSAYSYVADGPGNDELVPEGTYGVGGNAANYHPSFSGTPHSGSSMMMIVNGSETPNMVVWEQTVSVAPASDFKFSIWCYRMAGDASPATLQLIINGVNVGALQTVSDPSWVEMTRTWNSGAATSAVIRIVDTNITAGTNDFALDDASFLYDCQGGSVAEVTVTVDNVAPVLSCPAPLSAQCSITEVPAYANFTAFAAAGGTATDTGMGLNTASFAWVSDVDDGKTCPKTYTRTYKISDVCGNTTTCTQTIVIDDTILPSMVLNEICVYLTKEGQWTLNNLDKMAISKDITDNCTAFKDLIITFSPVTFDCNDATKKIPVTVKATDKCDNTATGIALVLVADTIKPVAKCQDVTTYLDSFGQAFIVQAQVNASTYTTGAPVWAKFFENETGGSYDNCGVDKLFLSRQLFTCNDVAAPVEVTLSAVDISGNVGTCKAKVTVMDTLVPVITQVANITMTVAPGVCTTKVTYPEIIAADNCPVTIVKIAGLGANGNFPLGTTTETWQATDGGGKFDNMSFTVTINTYNAVPAIATVADITVDEDAAKFDVPLTGIGYGIDCIAQQVTLDVANSNTALLTVTKEYVNGAATGKLVVTPLANKYGEATITLTVKDDGGTANGGVDTIVKTFKIKVNSVNDVPTVTPIADQMVIIPNSLSVNVVTPFKDIDDGDVLTFKVTKADGTALPTWMTFNATTGLLTGTPTLSNYGAVDIKVVATDKAGATVQDVFVVTVKGEFKIMGKVVRKTGTPVLITQGLDPVATPAAGVEVVLKQGGIVVVSTLTAADGTYSFAVPGGDYGVFVIVTGYTQNVTQNVTVNAANPIKDKVDFTLWSGNMVITNVKELTGDFGMRLYPNPTAGKVNIDVTWNDVRKVDVMVYNILGVEVFRNQYITGDQITIDMSDQVTGIYLVKLNAEGQTFVRKLTLDKR